MEWQQRLSNYSKQANYPSRSDWLAGARARRILHKANSARGGEEATSRRPVRGPITTARSSRG